jgi:virulence factor Mce-like protein
MRWIERGLSPVKSSLLGIVVLLIASYFVFTKQLPFSQHFTLTAVVRSSNLLAPGSPVRIGGVTVGKVSSIGRWRDTSLGAVKMQIDDVGRPIHADATVEIRPRLFLEGNFYIQLTTGTPRAPELKDGGTIPLAQTSQPVQIDQLLGALPADARLRLQQALQGFGEALNVAPSAADNARQDPAVRGLTGAQALNKTFNTSVPSLRESAIDSRALTGPGGHALAQSIAGLGRAMAGLARADGQLGTFVSDFDQTMQAMAAQQQGLRQTVTLLGPTAQHASTAFSALDAAFPGTERFADALAGSLPQFPATIAAAYPWIAQAVPLFSHSELGGLLQYLAPASDALAQLTHGEREFLPQIDAFNRCITGVFIPTGNLVVDDGPLSSGVPNYQEFWYTVTAQAAEAQGADGNGNFLRIGAGGGPHTIESGQTSYYHDTDTGFAQMASVPLRTRPAYPNAVPPLNRSVPCATQPIPDVNGPSSIGPADGSRPNAPAPPPPADPTRRQP